MQVACPHCRQVLEFADRRPSFCGFCGGSLSDAGSRLATTQAYVEAAGYDSPTQAYVADDADSRDSSAASSKLSDSVGDFKLVRQLGQGGMGVVYEAEQAATGRRVALKLLSPRLVHTDESMERFVREGRLAAAFSHPRSTFVFGAGQHAGQPYITMELMPGRTLSDVSQDEGPLPVNRAVDYILDVIEGLAAAHAAGVIHRDVKPSNCFLDRDGRVKVGDFGLSKSLVSDADLTRTGAFLGTPLFAAPEQVRAGQIDRRTDIYSVGATLFHLIAGRGPFIGDPAAVIAQIASDPAPSLRRLVPTIPKDLDQIVSRTLEKDPARRFSDLAELNQALQPFATGGLVAAPVGLRAGAYFIDTLVTGATFGILVAIIAFAVRFVQIVHAAHSSYSSGQSGFQLDAPQISVRLITQSALVYAGFVVVYFAACESWKGKSLGKRLLGLRVVGLDGGRPAIGRAFLRAVLVPGLMWLLVAALVPFELPVDEDHAGNHSRRSRVLVQQLQSNVAIIPMLVFLVTMRARNGYSGLHDLASGTRVVQIRPAAGAVRERNVPVVVPRAMSDAVGAYGPFCVMGRLGSTTASNVILQARDEALHRLVWVVVHPAAQSGGLPPVSAARAGVARPTRPRWLQADGVDQTHWTDQTRQADQSHWDAFEAVVGAPLELALARSEVATWKRGRFLLLDLAEELIAASTDGTLPASLSLSHVWLDRDGRAKLLDDAIATLRAHERPAADATLTETLSPVGLFRAAVQLFSHSPEQRQTLPAHAADFITELARRPDEVQTLVWAAARLRESLSRMATLSWSDRLVAVGLSAGNEHTLYKVPLCLLMLALLNVPGASESMRLAAVFALAVAMPVALGFWMRGGPVFRLLGIDVRQSDGRPASRVRCAWRNFIAWLPVILANTISVALMPALREITNAGASSVPALASFSKEWYVVVFFALFPGLVSLVQAIGACYAVASPQRGIQDLLAGTRLVPR